jgi:hypothetical protein
MRTGCAREVGWYNQMLRARGSVSVFCWSAAAGKFSDKVASCGTYPCSYIRRTPTGASTTGGGSAFRLAHDTRVPGAGHVHRAAARRVDQALLQEYHHNVTVSWRPWEAMNSDDEHR